MPTARIAPIAGPSLLSTRYAGVIEGGISVRVANAVAMSVGIPIVDEGLEAEAKDGERTKG